MILSYNGKAIKEVRDLTKMVADTDPGTAADLTVWRHGDETSLGVEIGQLPGNDQVVAAAAQQPAENGAPKLGVALARLTPDARQAMELPNDLEGAVVTDVQPGSPAAEKGLQRGDVILEADHQKVTEPKAVADAVRKAAERGDASILLLVKREGQDRFVAVPLSAPERSPEGGRPGAGGATRRPFALAKSAAAADAPSLAARSADR